jgi:formylglycine-generating enzyme required for sulfatase activity
MPAVPSAALGTFCLDATEVTVADYRACVDRGECTPAFTTVFGPDIPPADVPLWSRSCNADLPGRDRYPVNCVDWTQARDYCEAVGKRLPNAEEWEWAAAGGEEARRYPWGGEGPGSKLLNACDALCLDRLRLHGRPRPTLHYGEDGFADTAPVGSFPAGAGRWGHLDLAGNVWEFTATPWDGHERLRVIRGGGWAQSDRERIATTYRAGYLTDARGSAVGFRCAADPRP